MKSLLFHKNAGEKQMWAEQLKAIENISRLWKRSVCLRTDHNILAFVPHNWVKLALDLKSKWMLEVKKFE